MIESITGMHYANQINPGDSKLKKCSIHGENKLTYKGGQGRLWPLTLCHYFV